jgi:hypothetical protein
VNRKHLHNTQSIYKMGEPGTISLASKPTSSQASKEGSKHSGKGRKKVSKKGSKKTIKKKVMKQLRKLKGSRQGRKKTSKEASKIPGLHNLPEPSHGTTGPIHTPHFSQHFTPSTTEPENPTV